MIATSPTLADFVALRGERFSVQHGGAEELWAELVEAQPLGSLPFNGVQPFSLMFAGPAAPALPQRTYHLAHERMPALDIFLVPVGGDHSCMRYQAIFG